MLETTQGFDLYFETAKKIANVFSTGGSDSLAYDRDDYISDLAERAFLARTHFQKQQAPCEHEAKYVYRSMWNRARSLRRNRRYMDKFTAYPVLCENHIDPVSMEAQVEAKDTLSFLENNLHKENFALLTLLSDSVNAIEAADRAGLGRRQFARKLAKARNNVARVSKKMS